MAAPVVKQAYRAIIERIFFDRYKEGATSFEFERSDIEHTAAALGIALPKNLGDLIYSLRYRQGFPDSILGTQPDGMEWNGSSMGPDGLDTDLYWYG